MDEVTIVWETDHEGDQFVKFAFADKADAEAYANTEDASVQTLPVQPAKTRVLRQPVYVVKLKMAAEDTVATVFAEEIGYRTGPLSETPVITVTPPLSEDAPIRDIRVEGTRTTEVAEIVTSLLGEKALDILFALETTS